MRIMTIAVLLVFGLSSAYAAEPRTVKCKKVSSVTVKSQTYVKGNWIQKRPHAVAKKFLRADISDGRLLCRYSLKRGGRYLTLDFKKSNRCTPGNGFVSNAQGTFCRNSNPAKCQASCIY